MIRARNVIKARKNEGVSSSLNPLQAPKVAKPLPRASRHQIEEMKSKSDIRGWATKKGLGRPRKPEKQAAATASTNKNKATISTTNKSIEKKRG